MNIRILGLVALFLTCALCAPPASAQTNVADQAELNNLLQNWGTSLETSIRLPAGDFVIDAARLTDASGNIPRDLLIRGVGNTSGPVGGPVTRVSINGLAQFKLGRLSFENLVLTSGTLRANDSVPGLRSVSLHRVRLEAANIQVANGGGLTVTSSFIAGGNLVTVGPGNAAIKRNTFFAGGLTLSPQTSGEVSYNLFEGVTPAGPFEGPIQGFSNFVRGNTDLGGPNYPGFAIQEGETIPPEPIYTEVGDDWDGKLRFELRARTPISGLPLGITEDFEGDPIVGASVQIGADEVNLPFPTPEWIECIITGPDQSTLYETSNNTVPIVRGGVPLDIQMRIRIQGASDIYRPQIEVVVQPEGITATTGTEVITTVVDDADITPDGNDFIRFELTFTPPSDPENWDGLARVLLRLDNADVTTPSGIVSARANEILIDSTPPLIPSGILASSASSPDDATPVLCNGWTRQTDGTPDSEVAPHFFFNAPTTLTANFSVNVEDQAPSVDRGNGTFVPTASNFLDLPKAQSDNLSNSPADPVTNNSRLGTVSWAQNSLTPVGATATATHGTLSGTGTDVSWTIALPAQTGLPEVKAWTADLIVTDRAGNSTTVPLSTYFWWMPPNSTFANITADSKDPAAPSFSWELFMNGSTASASELPKECPSNVQFKICRADDSAQLGTTGWIEVLDWTPASTAGAVGPNTVFATGSGGSVSLVDLFRNYLGQTIIVIPRSLDPAGNPQTIPDLDVGTTTTLTLEDLDSAGVSFAGPYIIPSRPPEGSLDTIVTTTLFLNRLDTGNNGLWEVDTDETSFGAGPNVPLTPLRACNQRLEGQFLVDIAVPDNLPEDQALGDLSVEYVVLEDGKVVATGNIFRKNTPEPARLMLPTDLLEMANGGNTSPTSAISPGVNETAFLNIAPANCNRTLRDRLGDDGVVPRAGETDVAGRPLPRARTRPVQYTLIFTATTDEDSGTIYPERDPDALYDPTPTVVRFTVLPDQNNDSDAPPIKANSRP